MGKRKPQQPPREPDGVLHLAPGRFQRLLVVRDKGRLQLILLGADNREVQGDMDPMRPFFPCHPYARGLTLPLGFLESPRRVCVIGLGAGVVQKAVWRAFPEIRLVTAEIDPNVLELARHFFALECDARQRVVVADGREFLAGLAGEPGDADAAYDLIALDAFTGTGDVPETLATREFFGLCARRLAPGGVLAVNLLRCDSRRSAKLAALAAVFPHLARIPLEEQDEVFARLSPLPGVEAWAEAAGRMDRERGLGWDPAGLARRVEPLSRDALLGPQGGEAPLTDAECAPV